MQYLNCLSHWAFRVQNVQSDKASTVNATLVFCLRMYFKKVVFVFAVVFLNDERVYNLFLNSLLGSFLWPEASEPGTR